MRRTTRTCTNKSTLKASRLPPLSPLLFLSFHYPPQLLPTNSLSPHTDAVSAGLSTLSVDAQKRAEKDAKKKAAKAEANEAREAEKRATSTIQIKRVERNKRKHVTCITGLEAFGIDIKKTAKDLGKKFATGSSVTKIAAGGEEITVQGDLSEEIEEWLLDNHKDLPEDNIELIEDKKKKKEPVAVAPQ